VPALCIEKRCDLVDEAKAELAREYFMKGYNCSQSVAAAWCDEVGLDLDTALKISCGFGGGMGRMREVCGACSGAFMILGMMYGTEDGKDAAGKKKMYEIIQRFAARFKEENDFDSIICRELLGMDSGSPVPAPRNGEYYKKRPCPELVALASGLIGEFLEE
jgi:C_GCAxxG_C_C family probable redox protein